MNNTSFLRFSRSSGFPVRFFLRLLAGAVFYGCFLLAGTEVRAQEGIKKYIQSNLHPVVNIHPDNSDFADLAAVGDAIGEARVVMLGEQDHGDAATFLAKSKLIRYLHEKKGFRVLAFESDFFSLNQGWAVLPKDSVSIARFLHNNLPDCWSACDACGYLLHTYIPQSFQSVEPLQITGFDNQLYYQFANRNLSEQLDSILRKYQLPITNDPVYQSDILPAIKRWYRLQQDSILYPAYISWFTTIETQLKTQLPADDFWVMTAHNLVEVTREYSGRNSFYDRNNIRDRQMAANLQWLVTQRFPGEKIIVWAHNYHISKYAGHYEDDFINSAQTMGSCFTAVPERAADTYIVGFTAFGGTAGRIRTKPYKIPKPKKESVENWISETGADQAFVDFKKMNQSGQVTDEAFYMSGGLKGNLYHTNHKAVWNRVFDGVFYIREMYPCGDPSGAGK